MYYLIGADQKAYGPISAEQIRQWIAAGRVVAHTQVKAEGSEEWKPLTAYAELAELLKGSGTPPLPPPIPPVLTTPASRSSVMAIVSLALGILGFVSFGLTALVGLILGIVALVSCNMT